MEELYKKEQVLKQEVLLLEQEKAKIELEELDLNSKESMTKLKSILQKSNQRYLELDTLIDTKGLEILKVTRLLDMTLSLVKAGVLKDFNQIENFIGKCEE